MSWTIDKTFEFCYGHRVHTQILNKNYANDLVCACRHLHGHEGKLQVYLSSDNLDSTGMVTDFRHLEWLKTWINLYIDHKFIIDKNDPLFKTLLGDKIYDLYNVCIENEIVGWNISLEDIIEGTPEYEYIESFFVVDFVPTSENLSKWISHVVELKMKKIGVTVEKIDWWETPKSRSTFINKV